MMQKTSLSQYTRSDAYPHDKRWSLGIQAYRIKAPSGPHEPLNL